MRGFKIETPGYGSSSKSSGFFLCSLYFLERQEVDGKRVCKECRHLRLVCNQETIKTYP